MSFFPVETPIAGFRRFHPAPFRLVIDFSGVFVRLLAYGGGLAMLAVFVSDLMTSAADEFKIGRVLKADWAQAGRSYPAFALPPTESIGKPASYEILRHPLGGRRDILRWANDGDRPSAEIEIYRAGGEVEAYEDPTTSLATRLALPSKADVQMAGVMDTKFGPISLLRFHNAGKSLQGCIGFTKSFDDVHLRLSGWSCEGATAAAQRTMIGCALNGLTLLSAGNDPKVAEVFARSELRRTNCSADTTRSDWLNGSREPPLRGGL
jgi:hypothetical protein